MIVCRLITHVLVDLEIRIHLARGWRTWDPDNQNMLYNAWTTWCSPEQAFGKGTQMSVLVPPLPSSSSSQSRGTGSALLKGQVQIFFPLACTERHEQWVQLCDDTAFRQRPIFAVLELMSLPKHNNTKPPWRHIRNQLWCQPPPHDWLTQSDKLTIHQYLFQ